MRKEKGLFETWESDDEVTDHLKKYQREEMGYNVKEFYPSVYQELLEGRPNAMSMQFYQILWCTDVERSQAEQDGYSYVKVVFGTNIDTTVHYLTNDDLDIILSKYHIERTENSYYRISLFPKSVFYALGILPIDTPSDELFSFDTYDSYI